MTPPYAFLATVVTRKEKKNTNNSGLRLFRRNRLHSAARTNKQMEPIIVGLLQTAVKLFRTFMNIMVDSGLIIVGFITTGYIILVFTLLVYVKYEWCDLLFTNNTVS